MTAEFEITRDVITKSLRQGWELQWRTVAADLLAQLEQAEEGERAAQNVAFLLAKHTAQIVEALRRCETELRLMPILNGAAFLAWGEAQEALEDYDRKTT